MGRAQLTHVWDHPLCRLEVTYRFDLQPEEMESGEPEIIELNNYDSAGRELPATDQQREFALAYFDEIAVDVSRLRECVEA